MFSLFLNILFVHRSANLTRQFLLLPASSMSLMRSAVASVHCALRAGLDNERACRLPAPALAPVAATAASRNGRRCMEDRHVTIDDFDRLFGVQVSTVFSVDIGGFSNILDQRQLPNSTVGHPCDL